MALYAIGDLHLSFCNDKPMDVFGDKWKDHYLRLEEGFSKVRQDDTVVICGDLSWGMNLQEAAPDFLFLSRLPGKKIILKGNHDYWWTTASKAYRFFKENNLDNIDILNNNSFSYNSSCSICGTRGWFFEEEKSGEHDRKILLRELGRLETSLKLADCNEKILFLHYPPVFGSYRCDEILDILKKYNVRKCCYGHIHGKATAAAVNGYYSGIEFRLVSADYVGFEPVKIID